MNTQHYWLGAPRAGRIETGEGDGLRRLNGPISPGVEVRELGRKGNRRPGGEDCGGVGMRRTPVESSARWHALANKRDAGLRGKALGWALG